MDELFNSSSESLAEFHGFTEEEVNELRLIEARDVVVQQDAGRVGDRLKWGEMSGLNEIKAAVDNTHSKIVKWQKNILSVPTSKAGKDFVAEAACLLRLFNTKSVGMCCSQPIDNFCAFDATETICAVEGKGPLPISVEEIGVVEGWELA